METPHLNPQNTNENSLDEKRALLAEKVKNELKDFENQIVNFGFSTVTVLRGEMGDINKVQPIKYDRRYKDYFKTHSFNEKNEEIEGNGYIREGKRITFIANLGVDFREGQMRPGNKFFITIAFDKEGNIENENKLVGSIMELLDTIKSHPVVGKHVSYEEREAEWRENCKKVAKEGLPVLKAFKEIGEKYEGSGGMRMQNVIDDYQKVLAN